MKKKLLFLIILITEVLVINSVYSQSPLNWSRDEVNPGEDFYLSPDESFFTEGTKSIRMKLNSGAVPYLYSDVYYITPGAEYEFSVDVFDNDTSGQVKIYADFYDPYGFDIFGEQPVFSQDSSQWQTITWTGTVPMLAAVGYVLIKFHTQPDLYHFTKQAEVWIDNVQFRQAGGINLAANGGFEDWQVGVGENEFADKRLKVYPNPANEILNVLLPEGAKELIIQNIAGQVVYRKQAAGMNSLRSISLNQMSDGIFMISLIMENETTLHGKFIKHSGN